MNTNSKRPEWFDLERFGRWVRTTREARKPKLTLLALTQDVCDEKAKRPDRVLEQIERNGDPSRSGAKPTPISGQKILAYAKALDSRLVDFDSIRAAYSASPDSQFLEHPPRIEWRGIVVPNFVNELPFAESGGATSSELAFEVLPERPPTTPGELQAIRDRWIAEKIAASMRTRPISNDPSYALSHVGVDRRRSRGDRRDLHILHVRPCHYLDFLWPHLCLDKPPVVVEGRSSSLRQALNLDSARLDELGRRPAITLKLGANVVVVTSDRKVVVAVRSNDAAIAGGGYHASVAEGFLDSDVADRRRNEQSNSFAVALRGMRDELGLYSDIKRRSRPDFRASRLRWLGLALDTERLQPMLFFHVEVDKTFAQLFESWKGAKDRPENRNLIAVDWNCDNARALVEGRLTGSVADAIGLRTVEYHAASNHVQAAFAMAARHDFGP